MASSTSWDLKWSQRPSEEARNFNPAYCAELIARVVSEYFRMRQQSFGLALSFVVLPIVLHKPTREQLPGNSSASFASWIADRGPFLVEFPDRTLRLRPVTREALLFAIQNKVLQVNEGGLAPGNSPISRTARPAKVTDDVAEARSAASLLGRWFAAQANSTIVLQSFGVSP
ncbi:DUF6521 family protein [Frankia sp. RB7]|nr:DUF6521 family protein [Frankia sp. RB7]